MQTDDAVSVNASFGFTCGKQYERRRRACQAFRGGRCAVRVVVTSSTGVYHGVVAAICDGNGAPVYNALGGNDELFLAAARAQRRLHVRVVLVPTRDQLFAVCGCGRQPLCRVGSSEDHFVVAKAACSTVQWPTPQLSPSASDATAVMLLDAHFRVRPVRMPRVCMR
jgi:hypothetical protein